MSELAEKAVGLWAKKIAQTLPILKELLDASEPVTGIYRSCKEQFLPLFESDEFWNQLQQVGQFFDGIMQMAHNDLQTLSQIEAHRNELTQKGHKDSSSLPGNFWSTLFQALDKHRVWIAFMKKETQNAQVNRGLLTSFFRYEKSLKELLEIELLAMDRDTSKVPIQEQIQWQRFFYLLCRLEGELETVNQSYQSIILELEPFFSGSRENNLQNAMQIVERIQQTTPGALPTFSEDLQTLSGYLRLI
ncbi:MAG TPA: hypothetical protein P5560_13260 [Thermotogota bacterium]|nr:hypothetical protein [Thermotogota bacterium]